MPYIFGNLKASTIVWSLRAKSFRTKYLDLLGQVSGIKILLPSSRLGQLHSMKLYATQLAFSHEVFFRASNLQLEFRVRHGRVCGKCVFSTL